MKKRIIALLCAAVMALSLAGCTISSTPSTVGTIGETEITSGMYLLSQYQGYFSALEAANAQTPAEGETLPAYAQMPVKDFLKETITVNDEETLVSDYVAAQTMKNIQYFAAVDAAFTALNGELSEEDIAAADANAQSIWSANEALYKKNGFSLATVQQYQYSLSKADALMQLVYGENGTEAVSDDELKAHLDEDLWFVYYSAVPVYNTQNFQITDENTAKITEICQKALDDFNAEKETTDDVYQLFRNKMTSGLPAAYEALGNTYVPEAALSSQLLNETSLNQYFSAESAQKIRDLENGEAVMLTDSGFAIELYQRVDPVATGEWENLRETALYTVYGEHLQDALIEYGTTLESKLDEGAMNKLPANKIIPALG